MINEYNEAIRSLPAWGVWIEIINPNHTNNYESRHSPHGECGLKCTAVAVHIGEIRSLPAWGVWIEMSSSDSVFRLIAVTPRMGSVD